VEYVYTAMEVVKLVDNSAVPSNITVCCGKMIADDDDQVDPLFERNVNSALNFDSDSVEERFRVDRRKMEQLIQGGS